MNDVFAANGLDKSGLVKVEDLVLAYRRGVAGANARPAPEALR